MRAITCSGYGRPSDVLHLDEAVDEPTPAPDEVLVRVHAASLNPADWHLIRGLPRLARLQVGLRRPGFQVPGSDVAGVVEAVGSAVTTVRPGDEVYGTTFMAGFGAWAERVAVPERLVARRPSSVSFGEAAAIPLAATTALQSLRDHGALRPGQHVLVIGASGGVGTYAVQLAAHLGAIVTGVCSTRNLELVRGLGAAEVVDYTARDLTTLTGRYDLVLQLAGTHTARQLRRLLTPTGTLIQLSGDSPNRWFGPLGRVVSGQVLSRFVSQTVKVFTVAPTRDDLALLAHLVDGGALRSHVDRAVRLEDVADALEHLETGRARGKVVVDVTRSEAGAAEAARSRGITEG